jgi:hypothetical protein
MNVGRCVTTCWALVVLAAFTAHPAGATPLDKRTVFTVSAPFALPGVTLPAGCYMFRLADDTRGRDVVQVLSGDGTTVYAMLVALRTPRGEAADKAGVLFMETAAGTPIAVRSWWYPAESYGYEFLYPRTVRPSDHRSPPARRLPRHSREESP